MCLLLTEAWKSSAARSPGHLGILPTLGSVCPSHGFSAFGGSQLTCSGTLSDTVSLCGFWKRRLLFSLKVLKSQEHSTFSDQRQHWAKADLGSVSSLSAVKCSCSASVHTSFESWWLLGLVGTVQGRFISDWRRLRWKDWEFKVRLDSVKGGKSKISLYHCLCKGFQSNLSISRPLEHQRLKNRPEMHSINMKKFHKSVWIIQYNILSLFSF